VRFDRQSLPVRMAPRLGEHTEAVLREVGAAPHSKKGTP
jgi:crotonobetainyl-CoA:carnitine CoA-transferase CaiB-like acyl-CoA transferase